jgi:hypothetical protein
MDHSIRGRAVRTNPPSPIINLTFPHHWQAEVLPARPLILPGRHFVFPREAEEVERGALEVLVHPGPQRVPSNSEAAVKGTGFTVKGTGFSPYINQPKSAGALAPEGGSSQPLQKDPAPSKFSEPRSTQPFLATCALGFRDAIVPTGLWSCPNPDEICAVSGGYAYIISTTDPTRFTMAPYRPVLEIRPIADLGLLLFVSHHSILAWSATGQAWQSEKLSDEGLTITDLEAETLHARGWNMLSDKETPFTLDLRTGLRI